MDRVVRWLIPVVGILLIIVVSCSAYWYFIGSTTQQKKSAEQELTLAASRHYFIAQAISKCYKGINLSVSKLPPKTPPGSEVVNAAFLLGLQSNGSYEFGSDNSTGPADFKLSNYHNALIHLSDGISGYRVRFAANVARQRARMDLAVWATAVIGTIATVLISLKSVLSHEAHGYFAVGIFAIIFSSVGTAAASLNSFYSPYDKYTRSEQGLLQLRHLHNDLNFYIAQRVSEQDCKADQSLSPDSANAKEVKDFRDRFSEILNGIGNTGAVESTTQEKNTESDG
jgi:hypothetical protein